MDVGRDDAPPPLRLSKDLTTPTIYLDKRVSLEPPEGQLLQALSLACDGTERRHYFDTLRNAYRLGSRAVHGGAIDVEDPSVWQLLSESRDLCRDAILKRLDEGEEPDWTALVLDT